jgi:hypothetical protein
VSSTDHAGGGRALERPQHAQARQLDGREPVHLHTTQTRPATVTMPFTATISHIFSKTGRWIWAPREWVFGTL